MDSKLCRSFPVSEKEQAIKDATENRNFTLDEVYFDDVEQRLVVYGNRKDVEAFEAFIKTTGYLM